MACLINNVRFLHSEPLTYTDIKKSWVMLLCICHLCLYISVVYVVTSEIDLSDGSQRQSCVCGSGSKLGHQPAHLHDLSDHYWYVQIIFLYFTTLTRPNAKDHVFQKLLAFPVWCSSMLLCALFFWCLSSSVSLRPKDALLRKSPRSWRKGK